MSVATVAGFLSQYITGRDTAAFGIYPNGISVARLLKRLWHTGPPASDPAVVIRELPEPHRARLLSMYANEPQRAADGSLRPLDGVTKVSPEQGMALYRWACQSQNTLEIGMAFGFSTLFFAAAGNPHTAIDPFQDSWFMGIGRTAVPGCRWINERSDAAAIDLRRAGDSFDLIFIDGNHRFDNVLTDFYLYAPLCRAHGILVFDDLFLPSVQAVVQFVRLNRADFMEIPTPHTPNIVAFRKVWTEDARDWRHFAPFGR